MCLQLLDNGTWEERIMGLRGRSAEAKYWWLLAGSVWIFGNFSASWSWWFVMSPHLIGWFHLGEAGSNTWEMLWIMLGSWTRRANSNFTMRHLQVFTGWKSAWTFFTIIHLSIPAMHAEGRPPAQCWRFSTGSAKTLLSVQCWIVTARCFQCMATRQARQLRNQIAALTTESQPSQALVTDQTRLSHLKTAGKSLWYVLLVLGKLWMLSRLWSGQWYFTRVSLMLR